MMKSQPSGRPRASTEKVVVADVLRNVCSSEPALMFGLLADVLYAHNQRSEAGVIADLHARLDEIQLMIALELGQAGLA